MAADMEDVTQRFEADASQYVAEVKRAADDVRRFAELNKEAAVVLGEVRDKVTEAAAALKIYRDEQGKLRDESGQVITASEAQARALKHIRDQALKAAWAMRELKKYEEGGLLTRLLGTGPGGGGLLGGFASAGSSLPDMLPALLAAVPAVEAALVEVSGLVSGFAAAGAGAAAFYLLAHPAISNLTGDVKALSGANQALGYAQQKYLIEPTKANAKALHEAQVKYQAIYKQMGQDAGGAAGQVLKLHDTYVKLSNAFQPEAFKVINGFLQLANTVLPYVVPFAQTFADAISSLLEKADRFAGSKGFRDWLNQFHSLEGPAIGAIGEGIGKVVVAIGKLLTVQNSKDVVKEIGIAFNVLAGTIGFVTYAIRRLMTNWDQMSSAAKHSWYDIKRWTDDVTHAFDTVRHFAATLAHDVAAHFDEMRHDIASWGHDIAHDFDAARHDIAAWADDVANFTGRVIGWFARLPGMIWNALSGLGQTLFAAGYNALIGFWNGLISMGNRILSWVEGFAQNIANTFGWVLHIFSPSRVFYQHGVNTLQGYLDGLQAMAPKIRAALAQIGGQVAAGGLPGVTAAGGIAGTAQPSVHVTVPVTLTGNAQLMYNSPAFYQYLQTIVQEAVLRWGLGNPGNGFGLPGRA